MHRRMNGAAHGECARVIELKCNRIANRLLARVKFHIGLIDINMMCDAIVIFDAHRSALSDTQRIGSKSSAPLTDRRCVRCQTRN
jgi:hypothetical protein